MNRAAVGWTLVGVGAVAGAIGAIVAIRRAGSVGLPHGGTRGGLGRAGTRAPKRPEQISWQKYEVETDEGVVLKHYRKKELPIEERVAIIQDLTAKSVKRASMRQLALAITGKGDRVVSVRNHRFTVSGADCPARDGKCEARAIDKWMRANIRYTGDVGPHKLGRNGPVEGVDLFQRADRTVEFGGGDCDDHSILGCTLLLHNGLACQLRVTSPRSGPEDDFAHIYAMAGLPKNAPTGWVAIDTTLPGQNFGVQASFRKKRDFVA